MARRAGGQAVFEGVMMRGTDRWAVAVRTPTGEIEVSATPLPIFGQRFRQLPFLRGIAALAEAIPLGLRALRWSAVHGLGQAERRARPWERVVQVLVAVVVVAAVVTLPAVGATWLTSPWDSAVLGNIVEGVLGIVVLVVYVAVIGQFAEVRRLFENHGAEHKVVAAYEAGVPLTPEWAARFGTRHVRCGTSFLLVVGVVSACFYVLLGRPALPLLVASRLAVIPLVAAVAAEIQLRAADNLHRGWVRLLMRPGLGLQRLTTHEPSAPQLEVAIAALRAALTPAELAEVDAWVDEAADVIEIDDRPAVALAG